MRQLLQDHLDLRAIREEEHLHARPGLRVRGPDGRTRPWREAAMSGGCPRSSAMSGYGAWLTAGRA
ncbi:hypothetical protein ACWGLF_46805 [Streptomyces puniciscabiei]